MRCMLAPATWLRCDLFVQGKTAKEALAYLQAKVFRLLNLTEQRFPDYSSAKKHETSGPSASPQHHLKFGKVGSTVKGQ